MVAPDGRRYIDPGQLLGHLSWHRFDPRSAHTPALTKRTPVLSRIFKMTLFSTVAPPQIQQFEAIIVRQSWLVLNASFTDVNWAFDIHLVPVHGNIQTSR